MAVLANQLRKVEDFQLLYGIGLGERAFLGSKRPINKAADPILTSQAGEYSVHYDGAQLWLQMNWSENNAWGVLRKVPWGGARQEDGFRVTTALPTTKNSAVTEGGNLPDPKRTTRAFVSATPVDIAYTFEATERAFRAGMRGQGTSWESDKEEAGIVHARGISEDMGLGIGNSYVALSGKFHPIDKVVSNYTERATLTTDYRGTAITNNDVDIYGIDRHTAASWADSTVLHNSTTVRPITTALLYQLIRTVALNSGEPYAGPGHVFLTGYSTWERIGLIEEGKQRFSEVQVSTTQFNGIPTPPGRNLGFMANAFMGIPILWSQDIADQTSGVAPMYYLDNNWLMFWTDIPTIFHQWGTIEGGEIVINKLAEVGMFRTAGQTMCKKFRAQGKLRDIGA